MKQDLMETTKLKTLFLISFPTHLILPTPHWCTINSIHEIQQKLQFPILHSSYKIDILVEDPIGKLQKISHTCFLLTANLE